MGKFGTTRQHNPEFTFMESFIIRWGLFQVSLNLSVESHSQRSHTHRYVWFFSRKAKVGVSKLVYIQEKVKWITSHILISIFVVTADEQSCQSSVPDGRLEFVFYINKA